MPNRKGNKNTKGGTQPKVGNANQAKRGKKKGKNSNQNNQPNQQQNTGNKDKTPAEPKPGTTNTKPLDETVAAEPNQLQQMAAPDSPKPIEMAAPSSPGTQQELPGCPDEGQPDQTYYQFDEPQPEPTKSQEKYIPPPLRNSYGDWRTLSNRIHNGGSTIEMMYTGPECMPQPPPMAYAQADPEMLPPFGNFHAIPGQTHATVSLPPGVLPTAQYAPNVPSLMNAMDFFAYPERHPPDFSMGPSTTFNFVPQQPPPQSVNGHPQMQSVEVLPLGCVPAPPLDRSAFNLAFQSFSFMKFTPNDSTDARDGSAVFDADFSPTYMLSPHMQHRLQAAVLQEEIPLHDALESVLDEIREEHRQMRSLGLEPLPAQYPLPIATMCFHQGPPTNPVPNSLPVPMPNVGPQQQQQQQQQWIPQQMPNFTQPPQGYVATGDFTIPDMTRPPPYLY